LQVGAADCVRTTRPPTFVSSASIARLLDFIYTRAPYTAISRAVHIHPISELIPTMLQELTPLA
jgi:hypothetical protein